ncbi:MAG: zinc ribbon domain-containing protein [Ruminococcus sp.]|nr:zinc ribbon domain-containing protein [Ruminococcus sp.]
MFCPKCGTKLDDNAAFCTTCNHRFEHNPLPEENMMPNGDTPPMQGFAQGDIPPVTPPQQAPTQPTAKVKSHKGLTIFLSVLLALAVGASALYYFNPGGIFGSSDDDDDDSSSKSSSSTSSSAQEGSLISGSGSDSSSEGDESSESDSSSDDTSSETDTETTTTTTADSSQPDDTDTTTTTATGDSSSEDDSSSTETDTGTTTTSDNSGGSFTEDEDYKEAMKHSTDAKPMFSDFDWCYGQIDLIRQMPSGVTQIKTANRMAGGWKCLFIYSTSKNSEMIAREINNVTIDPTADEVTMTIDWYRMEIPNSEAVPEDNMDDTVFPVNIGSNGALTGEPNGGTIVISQFWNDGKNDYAVGEYQTDSGVYAYVALYR